MRIFNPYQSPLLKKNNRGFIINGGLSAGGGIPITSGLNVWLDPSDLSTLFQDNLGVTPVTSDGDPVGLILDKSSSGYNASQSSASLKPTYKTDGTYHWIAFDGSERLEISNLYDGAVDSDNTMIAGAEVDATSNRYLLGATGDDGFEFIFQNGKIRPFVGTAGGNVGGNGTTDTRLSTVVVASDWDRSTGKLRGWQDQNLEVDLTGPTADKLNGADAWIGQGFSATAAYFNGRMYGLSIYTELLSDADRNSVEDYMAEKSGISLGPSLCSPVTLNISQLPSPNDQTMALTGANSLTVETTSLGNTGLQSAVIATETFQTSTDEVKIEITLDKNTTSTTQASFSVLFLQGIGVMAGVQYSPNVGGGTLLDLDSGASLVTGIGATAGYALACYIKADGTARYAAGNGSIDDSGSLSVDAAYSNASSVVMASIVNAGSTTSQELDVTCNYGSSAFELGEDAERHCNV